MSGEISGYNIVITFESEKLSDYRMTLLQNDLMNLFDESDSISMRIEPIIEDDE